MRRFLIFVLLFVVTLAFAVWLSKDSTDSTKPEPGHYQITPDEPKPAKQETKRNKSNVTVSRKTNESTSKQASSSEPKKKIKAKVALPKNLQLEQQERWMRDNGYVAFAMKEGYAVGFGDILLGEPSEKMEQGFAPFHDPPSPWHTDEIAYYFRENLANRSAVLEAINYFNDHTPVRFYFSENEADAIYFEKAEKHCYSYLGRIGGHQPIRLSTECGVREIKHELMHALGFIHEHSRTDRDQYIEVNWQNIDPAYHNQFFVAPDSLMEPLRGTPFDYQSIMLYDPRFFAKDPKQPSLHSRTSQRIRPTLRGLSVQDLARIQVLFRK